MNPNICVDFQICISVPLSSVFNILRKENKIFQDLRISTDFADSALGYRGIFEGWKVGCITYLEIYIKIKVNTMD